ncbi:MAG: amidophosphoribosyltransferase [Nanoarchaeota archaeon]|nr:amidophosphoribosyltransferase [Nanoarchaeota archaeon]
MCGIIGLYLKSGQEVSTLASQAAIQGLSMLQHRGQRSAGITVFNPQIQGEPHRKVLVTYKDVGLVPEVFKLGHKPEYEKILERCRGRAVIGQTRYSTAGARDNYFSGLDETQPFERRHPRAFRKFAICFNGNIANYSELAEDMKERGYLLETDVDTEVLMNLFSLLIARHSDNGEGKEPIKPNLFHVMKDLVTRLDGAYNILSLFGDGDLLAFRDPQGFHPLCWGENDNYYGVASESAALESMGIKKFEDVKPGQAFLFNSSGVQSQRLVDNGKSFCHFEDIYFAKAHSVIDGVVVKDTRIRAGRELAKNELLIPEFDDNFLVVPAPFTAIPAAEAYARALGLEFRHSIEKREGVRGFINGADERKRIMNSAYIFHQDVSGRKLIIVDDSMVRGETSAKLIAGARNKGALEVHLRLTEPMIKNPCFYGIDYPTRKELIASRLSYGNPAQVELENRIAEEIGADSVRFQTLDGLISAIGRPRNELCLACLTGEYPTPCGQKYAALAQ